MEVRGFDGNHKMNGCCSNCRRASHIPPTTTVERPADVVCVGGASRERTASAYAPVFVRVRCFVASDIWSSSIRTFPYDTRYARSRGVVSFSSIIGNTNIIAEVNTSFSPFLPPIYSKAQVFSQWLVLWRSWIGWPCNGA